MALPRHARWLCYALAAIGGGWLCACIAPRVASPWPLEWMEGASLEHAWRLLHGRPIYAAPSGEFIPFIYPPLAYVPFAFAIELFGPTLIAGRVVSVLALAVSLFALARAATRLADREAGFLAAGLYALGYGYSGGFLDVVRVDGVFMAIVIVATERLCAGRDRSALMLFALSCFAKQHGLFFFAAACAFTLIEHGRARWSSVIAASTLLALTFAALECWSGGWFGRYVIAVPRAHALSPTLLVSFLAIDLGVYLPVLSGLALFALWTRRRRWLACDWLLVAGVVASAIGRAHRGGDDNVRLPAYALLVLVAAISFSQLARSHRASLVLGALLLAQAAMLIQPPSLFAPTCAGDRAFERLRAELQRCAGSGSSVAPDHVRLTGSAFLHSMAYFDLISPPSVLADQARAAANAAFARASAPNAIALSAISLPLMAAMGERYEACARVDDVRLPTGYSPGATVIYRRRDQV
ncbi:MAG TPA: glycosyltransferase family 39 protein, partial [Polyangiales bacterium]|nr:glycosyltransferase family 39 protein [Polyangiales bacterium]